MEMRQYVQGVPVEADCSVSSSSEKQLEIAVVWEPLRLTAAIAVMAADILQEGALLALR
jgi:hypothetical protein